MHEVCAKHRNHAENYREPKTTLRASKNNSEWAINSMGQLSIANQTRFDTKNNSEGAINSMWQLSIANQIRFDTKIRVWLYPWNDHSVDQVYTYLQC